MRINQSAIVFLLLGVCHFVYGQKKFKVMVEETATLSEVYCLVDENEKLIRQLDTSKYLICFNTDQFVNFAVFGVKGSSGWTAIDANENVLFKVYNTSFGEPTPDYLIENKIRIVDDKNLIGFANARGEVIIPPQFEMASSFHKGKAIIGQRCKKEPWDKHTKETGCQHYSLICGRHGYINEKGSVLKMGDYSFEQIMKQIDWKAPEE